MPCHLIVYHRSAHLFRQRAIPVVEVGHLRLRMRLDRHTAFTAEKPFADHRQDLRQQPEEADRVGFVRFHHHTRHRTLPFPIR